MVQNAVNASTILKTVLTYNVLTVKMDSLMLIMVNAAVCVNKISSNVKFVLKE